MARPRLWLLNFDADEELANPGGHAPSRVMLSRFEQLRGRVIGLVPNGDRVIEEWAPSVQVWGEGHVGRAFCPTPRALRAWKLAGAAAPAAPPIEVLRRVNHRRFSAGLGQTLPGARYVATPGELAEVVAEGAGLWLFKRPFGFAGRGRRRIMPGEIAANRTWIDASLADGEGLQAEPWVDRLADFGLHGFLNATGALTLGAPTFQEVEGTGAWISTRRAHRGELSAIDERGLFAEAQKVAKALHEVGYFGPFGIDAYTWRGASGTARFNPRSEINARYSMGWAIGMGDERPDLADGD